jgi:putative RecB family exonuclease
MQKQLQPPDGGYQPPKYLSASSIQTWKQCPLKFRYSRLDGIPETPSEHLMLGNFVHEVLANVYRRPPEERNLTNTRNISSFTWTSGNWAETVASVLLTEDAVREFRWVAWWCIENLWIIEDPTKIKADGVEQEFLSDISGVRVRGFIDRYTLDGDGATISDYKTGKLPTSQYMSDKWFQLGLYAQMVSINLGAHVKNIELLYLKEAVRVRQELTPELLASVVSTVITVQTEIEQACATGVFATKKSKLCDWCSYKKICPAWGF